jgi:chloramphenicol O-acetyltransferase type A
MTIIDIDTWNRKEYIAFFQSCQSVSGNNNRVDCTDAYTTAKDQGASYFAHYLHKSMIAVNAIKTLKLRIVEDKVVFFPVIGAGATIAWGGWHIRFHFRYLFS